ncbi:(2,3-dihydroxybenzoyl)adenylate synthase [Henriciella aquimarina]|uniref:(2,3-dihydroxybenzoyl)adenylate synthase n=1 Tax=Henriciella aquimarina TaxID=545261 RepID=UPI000A073B7D|nr:AMP-binding protein [Henriciella aquimarina]
MIEGFIPWPAEAAERYRREGYWEDLTVTDVVFQRCDAFPDRTAVIDGDRALSYGELKQRVEQLAAQFVLSGIEPEDRVVVQLPNTIEFVLVYLALVRTGAIPVMALPAHRQREVEHFVSTANARALITTDIYRKFDFRPMAEAVRSAVPSLKHVFILGEPLAGQISLHDMLQAELSEEELTKCASQYQTPPDSVATMLLSGGTTSLSKLIPRTHNDYVLNAKLCGEVAGFGPETVFLAILPLGHNYNLASPGILGVFYYGGTVVVSQDLKTEAVFSLVEKHGVTVIAAAVPLITRWLASRDEIARFDLSSLRVIQNGGAKLAPELRRRLQSSLGCTPQEIYGTAEGLVNMTRLDDPEELILESSGAPVCEADEIKVLGEDGQELPDGETGELVVRGPYTICGYFNAPEKNETAFTADGFYRMGDAVRKEGRYVYCDGRKQDLINRGGEKISCDEIESIILEHPKVELAAVVAMPDPEFGEKGCAFVQLKDDETLTLEELVSFLKQQGIASFKFPERLEVQEQLPLSPVGKVLKKELRAMVTEEA